MKSRMRTSHIWQKSRDVLPPIFSPSLFFNYSKRYKKQRESHSGCDIVRIKMIWLGATFARLCVSDLPVLADLPRTCFSRPSMTWTACCRMISLVWALSLCRWTWHILPSSLKASLMSRTRTLSLALLASRRSRSLCSFSSAVRFSSVTETTLPGGEGSSWRGWLTNPNNKPCWS